MSAQIVRDLYAAYAAMDIPAIDASMSEDSVMHIPGRHPLAGDKIGKEAIWAYLAAVAEISQGIGGYEVVTVTEDAAGTVVALLIGTIRDFVRPTAHIYRIVDGRVAEFWEASYDQHAEDAFWNAALPS
ncbi:MAG: nuclear transport factor 2 family protein [Frankiales bacterium]|jgi:ketosteroid isomerase-like protein|nr:nuclear transport factor 2 family protein [Frankiales bacterium]